MPSPKSSGLERSSRARTTASKSPSAAPATGRKPTPRQLSLTWSVPALTAGVDEAGRGPLAGPVVAAAVILDPKRRIKGLNDSKKLTPEVRERLYDEIMDKALCCSVAEATVGEIEELNILHATMLAMKRAVESLRLKPGKVLVDGNRLPVLKVSAEAIIGGDASVAAIAAASILAKVHRDRLCVALHESYPLYGFDVHKGYATPAHLAALKLHGACEVHRRGFAPVRELLEALQMPGLQRSAEVLAEASGLPLPYTPDLIDAAFGDADAGGWDGLRPDASS